MSTQTPSLINPRTMTTEDRAIWQSGPCRYEDYELEMAYNDHRGHEVRMIGGIGIAEHERNCIAAILAVPSEGLKSWLIY